MSNPQAPNTGRNPHPRLSPSLLYKLSRGLRAVVEKWTARDDDVQVTGTGVVRHVWEVAEAGRGGGGRGEGGAYVEELEGDGGGNKTGVGRGQGG